MATSSITHNFTISTPKGVEQFISAVEEAEKEFPYKNPATNGTLLTASQDILRLMEKRSRNAQ